MKIQKQHKLSNIRFAFDGIGGYHHSYGAGSEDQDVVAMGYGRTYGEALDSAMEYLAESTSYDIDLGYFSDPSTQIERAFDRAAAEAGIDPESTAEVDAFEFDDEVDDEVAEVGLVMWFDMEEVDGE